MAILTPLPFEVARKLLLAYERSLASITPMTAGSVNSNFLVVSTDGERTFLRVYEEQTLATAAREATLLRHLSACGVPTPEPHLRSDGAFVSSFGDKPVALFPFVAGESRCQATLTPAHTHAVGAALGRVHSAGSLASAVGILPELVGPSRFDRAALRSRITGARAGALEGEVARALDDCERELDEAEVSFEPTIAHGDLFRDNVLFDASDGVGALLDFESASLGSAAFDLAVTLLAFSFGDELDASLTRALLTGYASTHPLEEDIRDALYRECLFACTRFTVTRITDFELRPRGSVVYKDFRRFRARRHALVALTEAGLLALCP